MEDAEIDPVNYWRCCNKLLVAKSDRPLRISS